MSAGRMRNRGSTVPASDKQASANGARLVCALALTAVSLSLAGCMARTGNIAYNPKGFTTPDAIELPTAAADYRLGVGDTVTIHVFKVESLSGDQTIDTAGRINISLLGAVQAAGMTTDQLAANLTTALGKRYLNSPDVVVTLKDAVTKTVTVDGSVTAPGVYPTLGNTTLLQVIAMAHGTADGANPRRVIVFRKINGQRTAAAYDLLTIRRGKDPDPKIYANDTVVVDGSGVSKAFHTLLQAIPLATLARPY